MNFTTSPAETTSSHRSALSQQNFNQLASSSNQHLHLEPPGEIMDFEALLDDVNAHSHNVAESSILSGMELISTHSLPNNFMGHSSHSHRHRDPMLHQFSDTFSTRVPILSGFLPSGSHMAEYASQITELPVQEHTHTGWQGSFSVSEAKRVEIVDNVKQVYCLVRR